MLDFLTRIFAPTAINGMPVQQAGFFLIAVIVGIVVLAIAGTVAATRPKQAPKPKQEKQKALGLRDFDITTADEDRPVTLIIGRVRVRPNCTWFGDLDSEKNKDGLAFVGFEYSLGALLHIGSPIDKFWGLRIAGKKGFPVAERPSKYPSVFKNRAPLLWSDAIDAANGVGAVAVARTGVNSAYFGDLAAPTPIVVYFGYQPAIDNYFADRPSAGDAVEKFKATSYVRLTGGNGEGTLGPQYDDGGAYESFIGDDVQTLPDYEFEVERTQFKDDEGTLLPNWPTGDFNDTSQITDSDGYTDANPVWWLYHALVHLLEWDTALIDADNFQQAAQTLYDEGLGISFAWETERSYEDMVKDLERVCDFKFYLNPETGLYEIKLIRPDYFDDIKTGTPTVAFTANDIKTGSPTANITRAFPKGWGEATIRFSAVQPGVEVGAFVRFTASMVQYEVRLIEEIEDEEEREFKCLLLNGDAPASATGATVDAIYFTGLATFSAAQTSAEPGHRLHYSIDGVERVLLLGTEETPGEVFEVNFINGRVPADGSGITVESIQGSGITGLPKFDESDYNSLRHGRQSWDDTPNELIIVHSSRYTFKPRPDRIPNQAAREIIGRTRTEKIELPMLWSEDAYRAVKAREQRRIFYPLESGVFRISMIDHLDAERVLTPGSVFRLKSTPEGLDDLVCRLSDIEGDEQDSIEVGISWIEDLYAPGPVESYDAPASDFDPPEYDLTAVQITDYTIKDSLPALSIVKSAIVFAAKPDSEVFNPFFKATARDATTGKETTVGHAIRYVGLGTLDDDMELTAEIDDDMEFVVDPVSDYFETSNTRQTWHQLHTLAVLDDGGNNWELISVKTIEQIDDEDSADYGKYRFTGIIRGLAGTTVSAHDSGINVWLLPEDDNPLHDTGTGFLLRDYILDLQDISLGAGTTINLAATNAYSSGMPQDVAFEYAFTPETYLPITRPRAELNGANLTLRWVPRVRTGTVKRDPSQIVFLSAESAIESQAVVDGRPEVGSLFRVLLGAPGDSDRPELGWTDQPAAFYAVGSAEVPSLPASFTIQTIGSTGRASAERGILVRADGSYKTLVPA